MIVQVECYAGYKGDERPQCVVLSGKRIGVQKVEDRWYSPGATFFRVALLNGERYVLRRNDGQEV